MPKAKSRTLLTTLYLSAVAMLLLPATGVIAAEPSASPRTPAEESSVTVSPFVYGMRVWIDPETGEIRQPTKAEREAVAERASEQRRLNKSSEGLVIQYRKDGSKFVDLEGRFMHSLVLTRSEEGTLTLRCDDKGHSHEKKAAETPRELPVR